MENLFFERSPDRIFDLKGSMRNRMAKANTEDQYYVFMDENFVKWSLEKPLFMFHHSESELSSALERDTAFLLNNLIMDYSLLVGIDEKEHQLFLGVIDFIRTFTWDKKLEAFVKRSGILGGQGKQPTIISPDSYRKRFLSAMRRYFPVIPDRWTGLVKPVSED